MLRTFYVPGSFNGIPVFLPIVSAIAETPHHPPTVLISSGTWEVTGWVCGCWSSWMGTALVSFGWLHCHMSWFPILKHIYKLTCLERAVFCREKALCEGLVFPAILCPLPDIRMVTSYSFIIFFLLFHLIWLEQSFNEQRDFRSVCASAVQPICGDQVPNLRVGHVLTEYLLCSRQLLIYLSRHLLRQPPSGLLLPQLNDFV